MGTSRAYLVGKAALKFAGVVPCPLEPELTDETMRDRNDGRLNAVVVFSVLWKVSGMFCPTEAGLL